ncbi:MAG: DUF3800 domain-containing protein, partial [Ignavibacteriae bacterium]|nr:DUF3800 domain-containing protein [Ignavibacteriota bacterium]
KLIIHYRDIRQCEKDFSVLFDLEIKKSFYEKLNSILRNTDYSIISSAIKKDKYVRKFGKLVDDVYEVSLSSIIERAIYYLMEKEASPKSLNIKIEKRGKKEDRKLKNHFFILRDRGSSFITAEKIKNYYSEIEFIDKKDDIVGLQISDLVAYPIARYIIDPKRANPAYEVISNKLFIQNKKRYGIKIFP